MEKLNKLKRSHEKLVEMLKIKKSMTFFETKLWHEKRSFRE